MLKETNVTLKFKLNYKQFSHYISSTVVYFRVFLRYLLSFGRSNLEAAYLKKQKKAIYELTLPPKAEISDRNP